MNIKPKIHDTNQSQLPGPQTAALIGGIYNNGGDRGNDQQDDDEAWAKGCFFCKGNHGFSWRNIHVCL